MNHVKTLIDDGQRAYRLRMRISDCPDFDNPLHRAAWRTGYHSARDGISVAAALATFLKET